MKQEKQKATRTKIIAVSLVLTLTALALSTAAGASTSTTASSFKSGFYLGAQAGYSQMKGKIDGVVDVDGPGGDTPPISASNSGNKSKSRAVADILIGGRYILKNGFSLGGDVSTGYDGNSIASTLYHPGIGPSGGTPFKNTLKRTYFILPSLVIGKTFSPRFLGFIKLGLSISRLKNEVHNIGGENFLRSSKTAIGFSPAIGLEYACNQKISLLGTLCYERFGNIKKIHKNITGQPVDAASEYQSIFRKPQFFTVKFGVIIKI